ncbi:MAG: serine/threonine-protein kinase [Planctomycetota bacterium]
MASNPDPLQSLLAACVDRWETHGPAALEDLCARHPDHADALRQRIAALRELGLLTIGEHDALPERIGSYRVVRLLGRGGMGVVFEAVQEQPRRQVAVKVLRGGLGNAALRARFTHEALLLARLQHPGIAQIYEAGSTTMGGETLPFFAMELVRGQPITDFARARGLDVRARLELMAGVCDSVQHAHQKGVIHRDLKPTNILVDDDGRPKLLDFGVARAMEDDLRATLQTSRGQIVGTLAYMSPEQAAAEPDAVDTRSDVYSLGVVAHELLSGGLPYDLGDRRLADALRVVLEQPPVRLGRVDAKLAGDIETIVLMALAKDKDRRYPSAEAMASDLRRWLRDEPIGARAPTAWYTLRKFARRNRALMVSAVLLALALALGLAGTLYGMLRAQGAQAESERRWRHAEAAADFQRRMLAAGQPFADGRDARVVDVIARAARELDGAYPEQPEVEATLRLTIGDAFGTLGLDREARTQLVRAVELLRRELGEAAPETQTATAHLAMAMLGGGDTEAVRAELARYAQRPRPPAGRAAIDADRELRTAEARLLRVQGKLAEALAVERALFDEVRREQGASSDLAVDAGKALASSLRLSGRSDEALDLLHDLLAATVERYGERHGRTVSMQVNLAVTLQASGRIAESRELAERLSPIACDVLGPEQPETLAALSTAATAAMALGEPAAAETAYRQMLPVVVAKYGATSQLAVVVKNNLSSALRDQNKLAEAEAILRPLHALLVDARGPEHYETLTVLHGLATVLKSAKRYEEALPLMQEVLAARTKTLGPTHQSTLTSMRNLALLDAETDRLAEAEALLREAATRAAPALGPDHFLVGDLKSCWGSVLVKLGRFVEAERPLLEGYAWLERTMGAGKVPTRRAAGELVRLYRQWGKPDEATKWESMATDR